MQFLLDKNQKGTLFEQAREQLLAALHLGKLRAGDRLPSTRQLVMRNGINLKTALAIYKRLSQEGYIDLRQGSGAYVKDIDSVDLEQAYCRSIYRLIKANLAEAGQFKLDPQEYANLVQSYVGRVRLASVQRAVVECFEEQINLYAREISHRLNVPVHPVLLSQLESPDQWSVRMLARMDYFATTDFHFKQVKDLVTRYQKKVLQLRLDPAFILELVAAARDGRVLMVVSNTNYLPAFLRALFEIGTPPTLVERIMGVDDTDLAHLRAAIAQAKAVYISPVCDPRVRELIPADVKEIKFDTILSRESIEALETVMLFHTR